MEIALNGGYAEIATLLSKAIGDEVPDKVKLQQLSTAMYKEDKEEGIREFSELLGSLTPEYVSSTDVNNYGSVLRDAVLEGKTDFIQLLLEHGVDPTIRTDNVRDTPVQLAAERERVNILSLFAEHARNTTSRVKVQLLKLIIECEEDQEGALDAFKQQLDIFRSCEASKEDTGDDGNLLHFAVVKGLKEHVRTLLQYG